MGTPDLTDYVEVSERIQHFREGYPEGTLQAEIVSQTDSLVVVKAYAYRTPDDERPGTGLASEPIPGRTPYTKDSELMNAETSAWGRAIIAVGASDAKRGIASANEVRNRQTDEQSSAPAKSPQDLAQDALNASPIRDDLYPNVARLYGSDDGFVESLTDDAAAKLRANLASDKALQTILAKLGLEPDGEEVPF